MSALYEAEAQALRAELEAIHGQVWDTQELQRDYNVIGFAMGIVVVIRMSDGAEGTMDFTHMPRFYFDFRARD